MLPARRARLSITILAVCNARRLPSEDQEHGAEEEERPTNNTEKKIKDFIDNTIKSIALRGPYRSFWGWSFDGCNSTQATESLHHTRTRDSIPVVCLQLSTSEFSYIVGAISINEFIFEREIYSLCVSMLIRRIDWNMTASDLSPRKNSRTDNYQQSFLREHVPIDSLECELVFMMSSCHHGLDTNTAPGILTIPAAVAPL